MRKSYKKKQKEVNRIVAKLNKFLRDDEAFQGRIYLRQYSGAVFEFSDHSGFVWYGVIRIYDKVTNTYASVLGDSYNITTRLYQTVNDFIARDLQIDTYRAIALGIDYRNVAHNPKDAEPFVEYYDRNFSYKRFGL